VASNPLFPFDIGATTVRIPKRATAKELGQPPYFGKLRDILASSARRFDIPAPEFYNRGMMMTGSTSA